MIVRQAPSPSRAVRPNLASDTIEVGDAPFIHPVGFRKEPCQCPACREPEDPHGTWDGGPVPIAHCDCAGCTPPMHGLPEVSFMEPVHVKLKFVATWLFNKACEAALFLWVVRSLGGF